MQISNLQNQIDVLRGEVDKPFAQETELQQKSARLAELNAKLGIVDGAAAEQPGSEQRLAREARPSVLGNLKRPLPPRQTEGSGRVRKRRPER